MCRQLTKILHCIALHCTALHRTALHCTVQEEEQPWWSEAPKTDLSSAKKAADLEEKPWWEQTGEEQEEKEVPAKLHCSNGEAAVNGHANEEKEEESEWESEYEDEEEQVVVAEKKNAVQEEEDEEGEWEYYDEDEEEEEEEEEGCVSETLDVAASTQRRVTESESDERRDWIVAGLGQIIPRQPVRWAPAERSSSRDTGEGSAVDLHSTGIKAIPPRRAYFFQVIILYYFHGGNRPFVLIQARLNQAPVNHNI